MLFALKNRAWTALLTLAVFVALALFLRNALDLHWNLDASLNLVGSGLLAITVLIVSDGGIHGLLLLMLGDWYRSRFQRFADFFAPQRLPAMVAGGLLAGGEELLFRGVLLEALRERAGLPAWTAVLLTAVVFGLAHWLPYRWFVPFLPWAVWEGTILGGIYVLSGSLLLVVVLHILHDIGGFELFALQRQAKPGTNAPAA